MFGFKKANNYREPLTFLKSLTNANVTNGIGF